MDITSDMLREMIVSAVTETIETMAFMEVVPLREAPVPESGEAEMIRASLLILEPGPGEIWLHMPPQTASGIAQVLYGIQENEITDIMLKDIIGELLNTIAGRVMKLLLPQECSFLLGLPEIGGQALFENNASLVQCIFKADGNPFKVTACVDL